MINIIFHAFQTISEYNATSPDEILVYVAKIVPMFIPLFLVFLWLLIAGAIYYVNKERGEGNLITAMMAGAFVVSFVTLMMKFKEGLVSNLITVMVFGVTLIIFVVWFFKGRSFD